MRKLVESLEVERMFGYDTREEHLFIRHERSETVALIRHSNHDVCVTMNKAVDRCSEVQTGETRKVLPLFASPSGTGMVL